MGDNLSNDYIKTRTIELYDQLPMIEEERKKRLDVRDEVLMLNYKFFGYVASHKFVNNSYISYEDKFQSACLAFMEDWWKFRYAPKYRTDLSFAVFFKPRITERMERDFDEVKYSVRRTLCMEAGKQLGKHWGQVKYDDLQNLTLPPDKMKALQAMFGSMYPADLGDYETFLNSKPSKVSIDNYIASVGDNYNTLEDMLIHEMVERESKLSDKDLREMSQLYSIDYNLLVRKRTKAEKILYDQIQNNLSINDQFDDN